MKKFILFLLIIMSTACTTVSPINLNIEDTTMISHTLPIIDIQFGDRHGFFLIDTGSNNCYISSEYLNKVAHLDLKEDISQFSSINSTIEYETSEVLVNINNKQYRFKTIPMYALNNALNTVEIIGILGSKFLRENQLIIDYKTNSIHK